MRHRFVTFNADSLPPPPNGEYLEFTLPAIPADTYNFILRYKSHPANHSVMRLTIDGTAVGAELNQISTARLNPRTSASFALPPPVITL